jgi:hypothetical protein
MLKKLMKLSFGDSLEKASLLGGSEEEIEA